MKIEPLIPEHQWSGPQIVKADGVYYYCEKHKKDCKLRDLKPEEAMKLYQIVKRFTGH